MPMHVNHQSNPDSSIRGWGWTAGLESAAHLRQHKQLLMMLQTFIVGDDGLAYAQEQLIRQVAQADRGVAGPAQGTGCSSSHSCEPAAMHP